MAGMDNIEEEEPRSEENEEKLEDEESLLQPGQEHQKWDDAGQESEREDFQQNLPGEQRERLFVRLQDPPEKEEVVLLVSTLDFEKSNQVADLIRRSGTEPAPGRWALLNVDCPVHEPGWSLVTKTSSRAARQVFETMHTAAFISGTQERSLHVMYVEPRNGGEILVEVLSIPVWPQCPEGWEALQMLVYHFNAYEM